MPRPFELDHIQSKDRRKEREIDPFTPLLRLSYMAEVEFVHQLLSIREVFSWHPTLMHIAVSSPSNEAMELPILLFEAKYTINFPLLRVVKYHRYRVVW